MYEAPSRKRGFSVAGNRGSRAAGASDAGEMRILLAEDTHISAEVMLALAERLKVKMDVVSNGLDAIAMVQDAAASGQPYDLVLLDVMMPVLDGVETAIRLRSQGFNKEDLPIIAVTAATQLDEVRTYRAAGMQAFLEKPVSIDDLKATLRAWGHNTGRTSACKRSKALADLHEQFDERKRHALAAVTSALQQEDLGEDTVMEIRDLLHKIAGTAGSFGDARLSEQSRSLEGDLMKAFFENDNVREVILRARKVLGEAE